MDANSLAIMSNTSIAIKIRKLRELRNYTQAFMAEQLGIQQNTYSHLESGRSTIQDERLEQIASVLNVPVEELRTPDPFVITMNQNHGNNGYVHIGSQQQHLVSEGFVKQLADQLSQVIKDQSEVLKEVHRERVRMMELLESLGGKRRPK